STLLVGVHGGNAPAEVIEVGIHSFTDGIDFTFDFNTITADATVLNPIPVVAPEGNIYFFSGESVDGTPLDSVYRMDTNNFTMEKLNPGLITPHSRGAVGRSGNVLFVAGGYHDDALSTEAQILTISESGELLEFQSSVVVEHPRLDPFLLLLPSGDIAYCGGVDASGYPVLPYDIFTPDPLDSGEPQPLE
ncbi:hypothetical protein KKF84_13525, partial [Myxococcota bacterium]|nr:hypothetical protein [Myxococcota bacterium]MBU1536340.1 hypothetical protein [Myxococcota bacterium]